MNHKTLLDDWLALWNGDYAAADRCVSADFTVHVATMDGSTIQGRDDLVEWIKQSRTPYSSLVFAVEVGPITDASHIVVRWLATGAYAGGFPGATAPVGTAISFTGTDILRVEHDQLVEYWLNSDIQVLFAQLGVHF